MTTIRVTYSSIDRVRKTRTFKTLAGARKYAQHWVGATPEFGHGYAISDDGVGKIEVRGCSLAELFWVGPAAPSTDGYRVEATWDGYEAVYRVAYGTRLLAAYDTHEEALEHIGMCRQHDATFVAPAAEEEPF